MVDTIERCSRRDFNRILEDFSDFWDDEATRHRHHVMFVLEFGDSAWVIRRDGRIAAYFFGFYAQSAPYAYAHMVGVRRDCRRRGLARRLYDHFIARARARGCKSLKATVNPTNRTSLAFHEALGMTPQALTDYGGPGIDRVVFTMDIA